VVRRQATGWGAVHRRCRVWAAAAAWALAALLGLGPAAAQAQAGPEAALPTLEAELEAGRRSLQQLEIRLKAEAEARRAELATLEAQQRRLQDDIAARRQAEERLGAEAAARIAAARRGVQQAEEQVARARQRAAEAAERQRREEEARRVAQARQPVIPPGTEKRVALVVGNAAYRDRPLANPVNDAQLMQATLRGRTVRVGSHGANAFGLHDMHGNVVEWVQDDWRDSYSGAPSDGSAWITGGEQARRVVRGGSWGITPQGLRSADRIWYAPADRNYDTGFRIAKTL